MAIQQEQRKTVENAQHLTKSQKIRQFFTGYDIFVSYSRNDSDYALALADQLTKQSLICFLDQWGTPPGKELPEELVEIIQKCSRFVLVGTSSAAKSANVGLELEAFLKTGRHSVDPITFVEKLHNEKEDEGEVKEKKGTLQAAEWYKSIEGIARTFETFSQLSEKKPSTGVLTRIVNAEGFVSRNKRLRRFLFTLSTAIGVLGLIGVLVLTYLARETRSANYKRDVAENSAISANTERLAAQTSANTAINTAKNANIRAVAANTKAEAANKDKDKANNEKLIAENESNAAKQEARKQMNIANAEKAIAKIKSNEAKKASAVAEKEGKTALARKFAAQSRKYSGLGAFEEGLFWGAASFRAAEDIGMTPFELGIESLLKEGFEELPFLGYEPLLEEPIDIQDKSATTVFVSSDRKQFAVAQGKRLFFYNRSERVTYVFPQEIAEILFLDVSSVIIASGRSNKSAVYFVRLPDSLIEVFKDETEIRINEESRGEIWEKLEFDGPLSAVAIQKRGTVSVAVSVGNEVYFLGYPKNYEYWPGKRGSFIKGIILAESRNEVISIDLREDQAITVDANGKAVIHELLRKSPTPSPGSETQIYELGIKSIPITTEARVVVAKLLKGGYVAASFEDKTVVISRLPLNTDRETNSKVVTIPLRDIAQRLKSDLREKYLALSSKDCVAVHRVFADNGELLVAPKQVLKKCLGPNKSISDFDVSRYGRYLTFADSTGDVGIWEINTGERIDRPGRMYLEGVDSVRFGGNGRYVVTVSRRKNIARIWDLSGKKYRAKDFWQGGASLKISSDRQNVAAFSRGPLDNHIRIHGSEGQSEVVGFEEVDIDDIRTWTLSKDRKTIALVGSDGKILIYRMRNSRYEFFRKFEDYYSTSELSLDQKGEKLAVVGMEYLDIVNVEDLNTEEPINRFEFGTNVSGNAQFNPAGANSIGYVCARGIVIRDISSGKEKRLIPTTGAVDFTFDPTGVFVAVLDETGVRVLDLATGARLFFSSFRHPPERDYFGTNEKKLVWNDNGEFLAAMGEEYDESEFGGRMRHSLIQIWSVEQIYKKEEPGDLIDERIVNRIGARETSQLGSFAGFLFVKIVSDGVPADYILTYDGVGRFEYRLWKGSDLLHEACSRVTFRKRRFNWKAIVRPFNTTYPCK